MELAKATAAIAATTKTSGIANVTGRQWMRARTKRDGLAIGSVSTMRSLRVLRP
jgi:hypothetical protein